MFASRYLDKNKVEPLISAPPSPLLKISVVIPCYREPDILQTLESLKNCHLPDSEVEVIVLINHSESAPEEIKDFNQKTKTEIESWIKKNSGEGYTFFAVGPIDLRKKWAGAGLARKKGMDEAVRRFNLVENPGGIVVSLDADTLVQENYFTEIEKFFKSHPKNPGATIAFSHQKEGLGEKHLQGIFLYEKYMDYYKNALAFCGYPYPMFTVGSAFAVTAEAYVKRGGMNRRQAGEDFYFLQNLAQIGPVGEIRSTTVFPSARLSSRVPFGTGPILQKWMEGKEDLTQTYNFEAFGDLKDFFDVKDQLYQIEKQDYKLLIMKLPLSVGNFLVEDDFWKEITDLNQNCSSLKSFQTRFFQKFNAFKILKFLNFCHPLFYQKENLEEQIRKLNNTK
ncbi:MAG TPA: glycosyltransferase [Tangfeifania sp.]|nr:glycosyltransferase [Tangfeifania sp.]